MVIGADAVIGDYCTLVQGNTIGQHYGGDDRPTIGDRFYAGTGAKILGKIEIGNKVRVGANAVVLNSLPDGVTVAALPARMIRQGETQPQQAKHGPPTDRKAILEQLLPLLMSTIEVDIPVDDLGEPMGLLGEGIGLDSIEMLRLIGAIEEAFQLTIDDDELDAAHFKTIGSLVSFIQERLSPC
jgi:acyl carrier protein